MYKTIRHGENSLQYTILPQNDDFRLEGKIKASGAGAGSSSNKKNKVKKPKRRSFFAYLGLLFVCTVIIGAVLVPFLVSAECLPNPTEWFLKTKAAFTKGSVPDIKENMSGHPNTQGSNIINKGNLALAAINVGKTVKIINKDGVEKIIIKVNKTSNTAGNNNDTTLLNSPTVNTSMISLESNSAIKQIDSKTETSENEQKITITHLNMASAADHQIETTQSTIVLENETTIKSVLPATIQETLMSTTTTTTTTTITPLLNRLLTSASVPNVPRASLQSSLNQNSSNSSTQPTITTRIMQVPLLKSTAKKPAMPPVLVKNLSPIQTTPDTSNLSDILPVNTAVKEMKKDNVNSDWIHSHWPYIDPSTYFQWNGYKTEDSVLLPALLGFALIGVILIITVCLVARNKRTIVTSVRKRNRNDIEETGAEDNTTLLTNSNLSDED